MFKLELWCGKHGLKEMDVEPSVNLCFFLKLYRQVSHRIGLKKVKCLCTSAHSQIPSR